MISVVRLEEVSGRRWRGLIVFMARIKVEGIDVLTYLSMTVLACVMQSVLEEGGSYTTSDAGDEVVFREIVRPGVTSHVQI